MEQLRKVFTLLEIMIIIGTISVLAALAIPNLLRVIAAAETQWLPHNRHISILHSLAG